MCLTFQHLFQPIGYRHHVILVGVQLPDRILEPLFQVFGQRLLRMDEHLHVV